MSESQAPVRIVIASYLEPHHVDWIRAVNSRLEVVYEPHLLPRPRYAADHVGQNIGASGGGRAALVVSAR